MTNTTNQNDTETLAYWRTLAAAVAKRTKAEGGTFDAAFDAAFERLQEEAEGFLLDLVDEATIAAFGRGQ